MPTTGLALTIGKSKEHAITAIQKFNPEHLILITSDDLAPTTRRRLTQWKKQFDLKGTVLVIEDLFGRHGAENIMNQTFIALDALQAMECEKIYLGITGGTMHMSAIASSVATMSGIPIFYVKQPEPGQVVQPNKDVLVMPNNRAYRSISSLPPEVIEFLGAALSKADEEEDTIIQFEEFEAAGIPPQILLVLVQLGLLEPQPERKFLMTYAGEAIVRLVRDSPNFERLIELMNPSEEKQAYADTMFQ